MADVAGKICETFGCNETARQQYQIAPGTNLWLCEGCWERIREESQSGSGRQVVK